MPSSPLVHYISKCTVKPRPSSRPAATLHHLTPWDLAMLSTHYIQKGLLFSTSLPTHQLIDHLKSSLATALHHFYPLAGRLVTHQHPRGISVSVECTDEGAEFIHATKCDATISDVLAPLSDVPSFVHNFFPLDGAVSHDGHSLPLLAVQLTELADGFFLACSFNHALGDGTSYWHFFSTWAEISRTGDISRPPIMDRWFIRDLPITLPFSHTSEFIERPVRRPLRERVFHFSANSVAALKARANKESGSPVISSFQALSAHVWRCITRARGIPEAKITSCCLAAQNRARVKPPLSNDYFGNSLSAVSGTMRAGELLAKGLGAAAWVLNRAVAAHTDDKIHGALKAWHVSPVVYRSMFDENSIMIGSSPRFDMYGCDFGWGKAVGVRSGVANKFDGKVTSYPGREGDGSVDLEVCLIPEYMSALERDVEFMAVVSVPSDA